MQNRADSDETFLLVSFGFRTVELMALWSGASCQRCSATWFLALKFVTTWILKFTTHEKRAGKRFKPSKKRRRSIVTSKTDSYLKEKHVFGCLPMQDLCFQEKPQLGDVRKIPDIVKFGKTPDLLL